MTEITDIESEVAGSSNTALADNQPAPIEQNPLAVIVASSPLEKTKAEQLKEMFVPYLDSMHKLEKKIAAIDKENPTKVDISIARETRLAISKNRTAAEKKKDELKQSVLIEGRIIDSFFGVINNTSKSIELSLSNIEKAAEIKEAARRKELAANRAEQLSVYEIDLTGYDLGAMTDVTFEQLLENTKAGHEKRLEDKRKEEENKIKKEALEQLGKQRKAALLDYWQFIPVTDRPDEFSLSLFSVEDFEIMLSAASEAKVSHEAEQQKIKEENERLKKQAEEKELQLKQEREAAALALKAKNELQHKRYNALQPYLAFTSANPLTLYDITTEAFDALLFDAKALFNKDKQEREAKELQVKREADEQAAKLKSAQDEAARAAAQQKAALDKIKADEQATDLAKKKAERAPDKEKLSKLANDITNYELPSVNSAEADKILTNVSSLLAKVAAYIHQNIEQL